MKRVPEHEITGVELDRYLSIRALAEYSGLSVRRLRDPRAAHGAAPIPHYRIGGKILVRRSEYDAWTVRFRTLPSSQHTDLLSDIFKGL